MRTIAIALIALSVEIFSAQDNALRVTVIDHVSIVDVAASLLNRDMAVVMTGNRITAVVAAAALRLPAGAQVIEASGKFVIPGLTDMHNHLGTGYWMPGPPRPGQPTEDFRRNLAQMLAWGFTTVFSTAHANVDLNDFVGLRAAASNDPAALPRLWGVGRGITVRGGHASQPPFASYLPDTPEEAREEVREMRAAGVDAIKLIYSDQSHTGQPPLPVMRADVMQAIIDESHRAGLKAYVHAPTLRHAKEVLRAGADGLVHSVADAPVDDEFIALMKKNHASYTTTLSLYTAFAGVVDWMQRLEALDRRHIVPQEVYRNYESAEGARAYHARFCCITPQELGYLRRNLRRVFDEGLLVLAGTDTGVTGVLLGVSSQMELSLLVEAGLSPVEALRTATINPATWLGREKDLGTVEVGRLADLVVLDADPLSDVRNIAAIYRVVRGGRIYEPARLLDALK
jgi:imidazolonepropionase-like amidohydrolase